MSLSAFLILLSACGGKDASSTAAPAKGKSLGDIPSDASSQAFAQGLIGMSISDFSASDSGGGSLKYNTMSFDAGNAWSAAGYVEIADEKMDCSESGTWSLEPAESATVGVVRWTLDNTDCPSRETGGETRAEWTLQGDSYSVRIR